VLYFAMAGAGHEEHELHEEYEEEQRHKKLADHDDNVGHDEAASAESTPVPAH
jgi:F-type H+-transporting ATPase subunit a